MKLFKYYLILLFSISCLPIFAVCNVTTSNLKYVSGSGANTVYTLNVHYETDEVQNNSNVSVSFSISSGSITSGGGAINCPCNSIPAFKLVHDRTLTITVAQGASIIVSGIAVGPGNSGSCSASSSSVLLPVELVEFKGISRDNLVYLEWETASEIENEGFEIEKSSNGSTFEKFGFLKGEGNSTVSKFYNFSDRQPANGKNYYRLKQIDYNGKYSYSNIISVKFNERSKVQVRYDFEAQNITLSSEKKLQRVEIFDISGAKAYQNYQLNQNGEYIIDLHNLMTGIYFIRIINEQGEIITSRFTRFKM